VSATTKPRKAARSSATVLVVDHDHSVRTTARRLLESHGCRVLDAGDSAAAERIAKLYVGPIHVILIELDVSGASGVALADRLRLVRPESRVLFMSRHAHRELLADGRIGARLPFIQKPFKGRELTVRMRGVLSAAG
jgi:two-component system, cell cycle sensor histidine kinase and response regulator CckA